MNFFEQQERSRLNVSRLVLLFGLSVLAIVIMVNLLVMIAMTMIQSSEPQDFDTIIKVTINQFDWQLFCTVGFVVLVVIAIFGLHKKIQLSKGGKVIAQNLGGQLVLADTKDLHERRLLNIVEEIAIASGSLVPPVYLIDEDGINAFAAGFDSNDAVIGVTRGALRNLSRDELQGVIAHEFSHIFNGDMRLNLKLIAILHGILGIGLIGKAIIGKRSRNRNDDSTNYVLFAVALIILGAIGTFLGNLIKAGISRQKEYLADASAVQFTRNPNGIAGALKKIGGFSSQISNPNASEVSHMFFAHHTNFLASIMDTHPPLASRIRMIDKDWNGEFIAPMVTPEGTSEETSEGNNEDFPQNPWRRTTNKPTAPEVVTSIGVFDMMRNIDQFGSAKEESIEKAQILIASIPEIIRNSLRDSVGAMATIYATVINKNNGFYSAQLKILQNQLSSNALDLIDKISNELEKMPELRFPIIEMAMPTLKQISLDQYQTFKKNVLDLTNSDSKIDVFEWALEKILFRNLECEYDKKYIKPEPIYNLQDVKTEASLFLSSIAHTDHKDQQEIRKAFEGAVADQKLTDITFYSQEETSIKALDNALIKLEKLKPLEKQKLLKACVACIAYNEEILPSEMEMLRAFSAILQCPIPLLV